MTAWRLHAQLAVDTHPLASLPLCELRLMDDANYPWLILVPRGGDAIELIDLPKPKRTMLMEEIDSVSRLLRELFQPDKLNIAALGNVVPQLHVHVIARYVGDPAWPAPVWGRIAARPYTPEALIERVGLIAGKLSEFR